MSIFSKIMDRIFHPGRGRAVSPAPDAPAAAPVPAAPTTPVVASAPQPPAPAPVDVEAVLAAMAEMEGGGGNWRVSIVDLLKLLQLDSSLAARKELADELGVHVGEAGSAEQNIALHKAVMKKLAENGGRVPDSFYA